MTGPDLRDEHDLTPEDEALLRELAMLHYWPDDAGGLPKFDEDPDELYHDVLTVEDVARERDRHALTATLATTIEHADPQTLNPTERVIAENLRRWDWR